MVFFRARGTRKILDPGNRDVGLRSNRPGPAQRPTLQLLRLNQSLMYSVAQTSPSEIGLIVPSLKRGLLTDAHGASNPLSLESQVSLSMNETTPFWGPAVQVRPEEIELLQKIESMAERGEL